MANCFRKKGGSSSKKGAYQSTATDVDEFVNISKADMSVIDHYLRAEFTAMDTDKDGKLTTQEFVKLLLFLGYGGDGQGEAVLKAVNKDKNTVITLDEYFDAMKNNTEVMKKTSMMRDLFGKFDDNKDGKAKFSQIEQGFRDMGVEVDEEMKKDIANMDENHDGKVGYVEFVHTQLRKKGYIS